MITTFGVLGVTVSSILLGYLIGEGHGYDKAERVESEYYESIITDMKIAKELGED